MLAVTVCTFPYFHWPIGGNELDNKLNEQKKLKTPFAVLKQVLINHVLIFTW